MGRIVAINQAIQALRLGVLKWSAGVCFSSVLLFFAGRVWWSIQSDPAVSERWFQHGWIWFGLQCGGLLLLLITIWGLIAGALLPCVGYSTEEEPTAVVTMASSVILMFVVGLSTRMVDGTALLGYLLLLNLVTHGVASVMQAVGMSIRVEPGSEGWLRSGWMGVKRLIYFGVTGYTLMMLVWWWSQDPINSSSDQELIAAARQGNAAAQNSWAVRLDKRGEHEAAIEWLTKAADQGHLGAKCNLSIAYRKVDPRRALALVTEAASQGSLRALYMQGQYYRDGVGTPVDKFRAAELFRDAAFSPGGYPPAMNDLMVLIHTELPESFRSDLFQKLRDGEIQTLEQAISNFQPDLGQFTEVWELVDDWVITEPVSK